MSATLKSRLPAIAAGLRPRVGGAVKQGSELIAEDAAKRLAYGPDPHHIRDDIHVVRNGPAEYYVVFGKEDTFYGHILENGSSKMAPRPFAVPAAIAQGPNVIALARGALRGL